MDPRDDGLGDEEIIEGQNEIIITLRDEIRALNEEIFLQKTKDLEHLRARQKEEKKLEDCVGHVAQKLEEQKVIHKHELETLSSTKQYLFAAQEENDAMKLQLERLDDNKRRAWGAVGRKNLRIQELRRRIFQEKALVKDERKSRRQVEAARESMRLRTLRPLQFRNLEMVYRLQCKEEWASNTLAQCQDAYEELQANKDLQLEAQKKSRQTVREIRELERTKVFKHCLVDHLTAESNELRDEYEKLEQEHAEMREHFDRIQKSLELARRTEKEVKVQLTHEGSERARLELLLDEKSDLVVEHCKELRNIKDLIERKASKTADVRASIDAMERELCDIKQMYPQVPEVKYNKKTSQSLLMNRVENSPVLLPAVLKANPYFREQMFINAKHGYRESGLSGSHTAR